jgi:hypothetical protein
MVNPTSGGMGRLERTATSRLELLNINNTSLSGPEVKNN